MRNILRLLPAALFLLAIRAQALPAAAESPAELDRYNTVFLSPSHDETGSIPLGNGNVGINLWVEEDGDLIFYVARNDSLAETMTLCKLGRVRVALEPNPFLKGQPYRQELKLRNGMCEIEAGAEGHKVRLAVFVDAGSSCIFLRAASDQPERVTATIESWRSEKRDYHNKIGNAVYPMRGAPAEVDDYISPDVWDRSEPDALSIYHRNVYSLVATHIKEQGMEAYADRVNAIDPVRDNTFGLRLDIRSAAGTEHAGDDALRTRHPVKGFELVVATHDHQTPDAATFLRELRMIARQAPAGLEAQGRTAQWWASYWSRSWIFLSGDLQTVPLNPLPLRLGADGGGGNRFPGELGRATVISRTLSDSEVAALAAQPRDKALAGESDVEACNLGGGRHALVKTGGLDDAENSAALVFPKGVTLEAWIKPSSSEGRIWDKCAPGSSTGFTFDLHGGSLRAICGRRVMLQSEAPVEKERWQHAACVIAPGGQEARLYLDGKPCGGEPFHIEEITPSHVTRSYVLNEYQLACQMRSPLLANFQGGMFRVDPKLNFYALDYRKEPGATPDDQFYGNSYWWQNMRFLYEPQSAQGSPDFYRSLLTFMNRLAPVMEARAEKYYGAKGIYFEECFTPFGLPTMGDFGWHAKEYSEPYARWTWQHCLEASVMMLNDYAYTGDEKFLREVILPYCTKCLQFFDTRFDKTAEGRIVVFPTHGMETYWNDVVNDMCSVAGLHYVTTRLLALPPACSTPQQRAYWQKIAAIIPPLPKRKAPDGATIPDNAEKYHPNQRANYEAPDLYSVFPFRCYGLEIKETDIHEAIEAWKIMPSIEHVCWNQYGIFSARLGQTEGAKTDVVERAKLRMPRMDKDGVRPPFRFPGFMGSPHDAMPDNDGPANMMVVLQEMLLQNGEHGELMLLQAWPQDWDATFKLHAHRQTTIEGEIKGGKVMRLTVTPPERARDVILPAWAK